MRKYADKKPAVSSVSGWTQIYHYGGVKVIEADNYYEFYKVVIEGKKPKYFFGELAWIDVQRFVADYVGDWHSQRVFY